jgi:hypothetical protein
VVPSLTLLTDVLQGCLWIPPSIDTQLNKHQDQQEKDQDSPNPESMGPRKSTYLSISLFPGEPMWTETKSY